MVNPVSSASLTQANEASKPAAKTQQPQQAQKTPLPSDTVTLKSTGDGDSK
jgi:hypothetical protein